MTDILKRIAPVTELQKAKYKKVGTTPKLEERVDLLEENNLDARITALENAVPAGPNYKELTFNWYQTATNDPVITGTNVNTFDPIVVVTPGYLGAGSFSFDFNYAIIPLDKSKVEIWISAPFIAASTLMTYNITSNTAIAVYAINNPVIPTLTNGIGDTSTNATLTIKVYN